MAYNFEVYQLDAKIKQWLRCWQKKLPKKWEFTYTFFMIFIKKALAEPYQRLLGILWRSTH